MKKLHDERRIKAAVVAAASATLTIKDLDGFSCFTVSAKNSFQALFRSKEVFRRRLIELFESYLIWGLIKNQKKSSQLKRCNKKLPFCDVRFSSSRPLKRREIALTEGAVERSQMPSFIKRSRISHEKIPWFSFL